MNGFILLGLILLGVALLLKIYDRHRLPPKHHKTTWMGMDVGFIGLVMTLLGRR